MTKKDEQLLQFIGSFIEEKGYAPSYTEMMDGIEEKSKNGIFRSIENLAAAGCISRVRGVARSISILHGSSHVAS